MKSRFTKKTPLALCICIVISPTVLAATDTSKVYSPYVDQKIPSLVLFGDTHLHTNNSPDAGFLSTKLGPEQAYRFARGNEVVSNTGQKVKLNKPLDFLVVADHAEYYGLVPSLINGAPGLLADPVGKRWYNTYHESDQGGMQVFLEIIQSSAGTSNTEMIKDPKMKRNTWEAANAVADKYNEPGRFTALLGYEWSSIISGNNLHRVVVYRDGADRVNQIVPLSSIDNLDPEALWKNMAAYEQSTGGQVLAIPHNGNWSNGMMFQMETIDGKPFDKAYAENRARWEPLYEVTQMKGDGETHPFLSPDDQFADFETWDKGNLTGRIPKTNEMLKTEYAREALKDGLAMQAKLGVNPFKFGMIGSTDAHTGLVTTREDNNFSKTAHMEPSNHRATQPLIKSPIDDSMTYYGTAISASGLAAAWTTENSRAAIFDAMKRKEVYATTGSRLSVRVFGGWDFSADEVEQSDFAQRGYAKGVPMGGDLSAAPKGKKPGFMIRAMRDPDNANLDRVQVVKGWTDNKGDKHERIYDVAVSDGRTINSEGRCDTPVGSTVNIAEASYSNAIGAPALNTYWEDPDFNPEESAFYYVRVLEIPKPRWTAYDAKFYDIEMPEGTALTVQDRAYTSPIWYTPAK
jgi:hypothetical protein